MTVLAIARLGAAILKQRGCDVPDPTAPEVAVLAGAMADTLADSGGVGLAAPQVYEPWRLFALHIPPSSAEAADGIGPIVLANPRVVPLDGRVALGWEGCLSIPGLSAPVPRWHAVRLTATALDGSAIRWDLAGFPARVVQHEQDHLDGIVFPERLSDPAGLGFIEARESPPLKRQPDAAAYVVDTPAGPPAIPPGAEPPAIGASARPAGGESESAPPGDSC